MSEKYFWNKWSGGLMPKDVEPDDVVAVEMRNGVVISGVKASEVRWNHQGCISRQSDVLYCRVMTSEEVLEGFKAIRSKDQTSVHWPKITSYPVLVLMQDGHKIIKRLCNNYSLFGSYLGVYEYNQGILSYKEHVEPVKEWPQVGDEIWTVDPYLNPRQGKFEDSSLYINALAIGILFPSKNYCQRYIDARKFEVELKQMPGALKKTVPQKSEGWAISINQHGQFIVDKFYSSRMAARLGVGAVAFDNEENAKNALDKFYPMDILRHWIDDHVDADCYGVRK